MIHPLIESTLNPADIHPRLADHQADMIRRCPYLGPSVERGLTTWSSFSADQLTDRPEMFATLVNHAEHLREERRKHGPLVCRNIAFVGPSNLDESASLMGWPAWLIRKLYAPVQIMVGRFYIGLESIDSKGNPLMTPPVSFFSMRHSIAGKDGLFLSAKYPEIMAVLESGPGDDGRDVFREPLGRGVDDPATAYSELARIYGPPNPTTT